MVTIKGKVHPIHTKADTIQDQFNSAFKQAVFELRNKIHVDALAAALATKNVKNALTTITHIEECFFPLQQIITEAVMLGGEITAKGIKTK